MLRLNNWNILYGNRNILYGNRMSGEVYDHPRFKDGTEITTSRVIGVRDGKIITRSGSEYILINGRDKRRVGIMKSLPEI